RQFSAKVGTIFEDSSIGLDKWLTGVWMLINCKNGISSCEVSRDLRVTQKTAWFMMHRIRLALQEGTFSKLSGDVEVDETFRSDGNSPQRLELSSRILPSDLTSGLLGYGCSLIAKTESVLVKCPAI